jgi:ribonuclease D
VLHAARQDLEVLAPLLGKPARIFDTQIAAALCGLPAQVGYAELVRQLLGVELAKAQTRTDWSKRPLSAAQLDYALDDVRYLLPLRAALLTKIAALGRSPWLEEELRSLTDPALLEVDPDSAWQRLRGLADFDEHRLRLAQRLAAWRERRAITRNRPRGWILEDAVLREMIQQAPRDLDGLRSIPLMPPGVVERAGAELLQVIAECALPASLPPLPKRSRPDPAFETKVRELSRIVKDKAQELALAPELLATRRDLERLARTALAGAAPNAATAATPLRGWRSAVVGAQLLAAL